MSRAVKFAYDVRAQAGEGFDLEIDIYQAIGGGDPFFGGGVSAEGVLMALRQNPQAKVLVRINSPGGSVTEGFAIYNHLMEHRGSVTTRVDGLAGSMASILMLAGEERQIAFGGTVMVHNPFGIVEGESRELRGIADMLDRQKAEMMAIYSKRTGLSAARVAKMMDETTWLGAEEALDRGFATRITGTPARMVAAALPEDLKAAPPKIRALLRAQANELLAQLKDDEPPQEGAQGNAPGSKAAMTEEEMKAAVAKAVADAQAAVDAIAKKDEEIASLKAALAEAMAKGNAEFPPEEEDEESKAVVEAAKALTGETELSKVEGSLLAIADRGLPGNRAQVRAELVAQLIKDGKLKPERKQWALGCKQEALDHYLEGIGNKPVLPLGKEFKADEEKVRSEQRASLESVTLTKDELVIAKTMGMKPEKALELKKQQLANGFAAQGVPLS